MVQQIVDEHWASQGGACAQCGTAIAQDDVWPWLEMDPFKMQLVCEACFEARPGPGSPAGASARPPQGLPPRRLARLARWHR